MVEVRMIDEFDHLVRFLLLEPEFPIVSAFDVRRISLKYFFHRIRSIIEIQMPSRAILPSLWGRDESDGRRRDLGGNRLSRTPIIGRHRHEWTRRRRGGRGEREQNRTNNWISELLLQRSYSGLPIHELICTRFMTLEEDPLLTFASQSGQIGRSIAEIFPWSEVKQ